MSTSTSSADTTRKTDITESLADIRDRVRKAQTERCDGKQVRLVAVSKTKPAGDLLHAYEEGQRHFGENVQELLDKVAELPKDINWHFIGTLQSNKCKMLASIPNLWAVETIDSIKKADAMNKVWTDRDQPLRVFVQVNTSGEASKSGLEPSQSFTVAEHINSKCPNLVLQGLMTIGSPDRDPDAENPDFKCLVQCKNEIDAKLGRDLELSMGMSDDFESAIRAGATSVRVGSSIFGSRNYTR